MLQHHLSSALQLLGHVDLPACAVDEFRRVVWWNDRAEDLFGVRRNLVLDREWHTVVRIEERPGSCVVCTARTSLRRGEIVAVTPERFTVNGRDWRGIVIPLPASRANDAVVSFLFVADEPDGKEQRHGAAKLAFDGPPVHLTPRERQLLQCIVDGLDARGIADRLGLSHATARNYVQRLLSKLDVGSKAEAVRLAFTSNLLES